MNLQQKINDYVRLILNKFKGTSKDSLEINETLSRLDTITKNQIWYRGDSYEIKQMFSQCSDYFGSNSFWIKAPNSHKVACRHYPMAQIIVDTLSSICVNDIQEIKVEDTQINELIETILKDSKQREFFEDLIKEELISGDVGVYPEFHQNGKIKFKVVKSENCEYNEEMDEWYVKNIYQKGQKNFLLITTFGKGYVGYKLYTENGVEVGLDELEKTKNLQPLVFKKDGMIDDELCLFTLFKSFNSTKFDGRGRCIYENRDDSFDLLDEVFTTWGMATRKSTPKTMADKSMLKKDRFGNVIEFSDYDVDLITIGQGETMNQGQNGITTYNPTFPSNDYYQTLNMAIQVCLVQILSPTSSGIDMRTYQTNVNTSYTNEIEKITIQTHNKILYNFSDRMKELILNTLKCYCYLTGTNMNLDNLEVIITFNDFSSPSDDKIIPLFAQAITSGFMSKYEAIKEWHVDWTEDMIQDELKRISEDSATMSDSDLFGLNTEMVEDEEVEEEPIENKEEEKVEE